MCYPKPGPRCSAHASMRLALMKEKRKTAQIGTPEYAYYKEAYSQAEQDYDSTPAGIEEIKRRLATENTESGQLETQMRLDLAVARRKEQLAAVKSVDKGDIKHKSKSRHARVNEFIKTLPHDFQGKNLKALTLDERTKFGMLTESHEWVKKLTPLEQEAVAWYTSNAPGIFNSHIHGKKDSIWGESYTPEHLDESIKNLDSALEKYEASVPVVVYRGVGSNSTLSGLEDINKFEPKEVYKKVKELYKPGSVYKNTAFMSSSYDPSAAAGFGGVILEIKTRHAAPVASVSAWGTSEREAILPRDVEYTVVSVKKTTVDNRKGYSREVVVLQLEEKN